ncbi:hypothetical protein HNR33_000488 [Brassicibacter mesophilus]
MQCLPNDENYSLTMMYNSQGNVIY